MGATVGSLPLEAISPLIVPGPTAAGKSWVARRLVDAFDRTGARAHIVGADKFYLYAGNIFLLGLGLEADELEDGRQRHLYGILDPRDAMPTGGEYARLLSEAVEVAHRAGAVAIIEGCSQEYITAACRLYGYDHMLPVLQSAPTMANDPLLSRAGQERAGRSIPAKFDRLVEQGLYEETGRALDAGYENTYPMRRGLIYGPVAQAVRGLINQDAAREQVIAAWVAATQRIEAFYRSPAHLAEAYGQPRVYPPYS